MEYKVLYEKFLEILEENYQLKRELKELKVRYGVKEKSNISISGHEKIEIFARLFLGRQDVYAKRWESKSGKTGYSPVCLNEWKQGICNKPNISCSNCSFKRYAPLNSKVIEAHLRGEVIIGVYPLLKDETCNFLAIDFDKKDWQESIKAVYEICRQNEINALMEKSRSGNGAHLWIFFESSISSVSARKLGTALLNCAMNKSPSITFDSYDRLFPNQDTMPKGNLGNLIALPLQKSARAHGNSTFIDKNFIPLNDQWGLLKNIKKLSIEDVHLKIESLSKEDDFILDEFNPEEPMVSKEEKIILQTSDFPKSLNIIKEGGIFIEKRGLSPRAVNRIKRLGAFRNPEFYKFQAMRMSTFGKPRIINCSQEDEKFIFLPRGCKEGLLELIQECNLKINILDKRNQGRGIRVSFKGELFPQQQNAVDRVLVHDIGVLSAATAFGKTVVAANIISSRKVNTLILVHRQQLLEQWKNKIEEFLDIQEERPTYRTKTGRMRERGVIGILGGGKNTLNGIIDIAIIQSLGNSQEIKSYVKNYGMVIVDECHHISAFSFENVMKNINARYIYGFTATPHRKDGHDPIIFMQCGKIRHIVDTKSQLQEKKFNSYYIPKNTTFQLPLEYQNMTLNITDIYSSLTIDEKRNSEIVGDVLKSYEKGRNILVLTERVSHAKSIFESLKDKISEAILLIGGQNRKTTQRELGKLAEFPCDKNLVIVATGKYIGEGFDESRLDTLFLAMPISWKGTLQQYAGRLHRFHKDKKNILIYDYVDFQISMLANMYKKRLKGYEMMGYRRLNKEEMLNLNLPFEKIEV